MGQWSVGKGAVEMKLMTVYLCSFLLAVLCGRLDGYEKHTDNTIFVY